MLENEKLSLLYHVFHLTYSAIIVFVSKTMKDIFLWEVEICSSGFELHTYYFIFMGSGSVFITILYQCSSTILPKRMATFLAISLQSFCFP
jgi:hypothetical protein